MHPIKSARIIILAILIFTTGAIADDSAAVDMDLPQFYGQVPWASVHRDSRNSDFIPLVTLPTLRTSWSVLDGAALINPGVIDSNGHHFMTTGRGKGFSHLHAFNQAGELLWETPPQQDSDDFDALAGFNSPVLDTEGDLYVGDGNQFWAFHPNGRVKWVSDLPTPGQPFVYQVISRQGYAGGITVGGDVLFYDRDNGRLAVPAFKLPAGIAPARGPDLPGLWGGGLFDVSAAELFKQIAFGYKVQVANAPAVHPDTGRIFITAAGPKNDDAYSGVLYGLDVTDDGIEIAFATKMGGGSGTSPALSIDNKHVYSADGEGRMLAVDTSNGRVVWAARGEGLLSPAIGADGAIYTGDIFGAPTVVALNPADGSRRWAGNYDDYAATQLQTLAPEPPQLPNGKPVARLVSVISASRNAVWVGMVLGYEYRPSDSPITLTIPHKTVVCALEPDDGTLVSCVHVRDTVEGMIKIGTAGRLFVSHTSIFGSTAYFGFNDDLPERFRAPTKPIGGVTALIPSSYCRQIELELAELKGLYAQLPNTANAARLARMQLSAMGDTLALARKNDEISAAYAKRLQGSRQASTEILANLTDDTEQTKRQMRQLIDNHPSSSCTED